MDAHDEGTPARLGDRPDWHYLLREVYELYRDAGAGGSDAIRRHQRTVRAAVRRAMEADARVLDRAPGTKPVCRHLRRALDLGRRHATAPFVRSIDSVSGELAWLYGYDRVPKGLVEGFAWSEMAGPRGPVETAEVIVGLVLFAPGVTYPAHAHEGIEESYYVLAGHVSQNDDGVFAPGSMMFNPPGRRHRITVGVRDPALLAYAWHGPPDRLAGQKLSFRAPR
jgi:dimethylpropiothetin dethiomethylase